MKIKQGHEAIEAIRTGQMLGVLKTFEGQEIAFYEYKKEVYASLKEPLSQGMFYLLVQLEVSSLISELIACERPGKLFGKYENVTRLQHVRLDEVK